MINLNLLKAIVLPGLLFQSVVIAGGYATGRELVEYFLSNGPMAGFRGMLLTALVWGIVMSVSFEFARLTKSYDYRHFFKHLLGRFWFVFEVVYFPTLLLVLAVVGSAAGAMFAYVVGLPPIWGTLLLIITIGILNFKGSAVIERVLAGWSLLLYLVYAIFLIAGFMKFGDRISEGLEMPDSGGGWALGGLRYASYSLASIPVILFCINHVRSRKEAITAGLLGGLLGILPAVLFYFVMAGFYPDIVEETIPVNVILTAMELPWLLVLYNVVIFGTFIETGAAMLHAVNERIARTYEDRGGEMSAWIRPVVAVGMLVVAIFVSDRVGLVNLIAKGYGTIAYLYLMIFILPVLTVGIYLIYKMSAAPVRTP